MLSTKGTNQKGNFENFKCSDENSPNSCLFLKQQISFFRILHHSSVSWDITPLYFCTFMGSFCRNHIKFQLRKYSRVVPLTLKSDANFKEKLTCGFKCAWEIWWIFTQPIKSLKISFRWPLFVQSMQGWSYKYRGVIFHDTEQRCKI